MNKVVRLLRGFEKSGDALVSEIALADVTLEQLQKIFNRPPDDKMYDCYPVGIEEMKKLQPYAEQNIDLDKLDFFLECDAV